MYYTLDEWSISCTNVQIMLFSDIWNISVKLWYFSLFCFYLFQLHCFYIKCRYFYFCMDLTQWISLNARVHIDFCSKNSMKPKSIQFCHICHWKLYAVNVFRMLIFSLARYQFWPLYFADIFFSSLCEIFVSFFSYHPHSSDFNRCVIIVFS